MCCRCTQSYKHDRVYTLRSEEGVELYKFYYTRFSVYIQSDYQSDCLSWAPFFGRPLVLVFSSYLVFKICFPNCFKKWLPFVKSAAYAKIVYPCVKFP